MKKADTSLMPRSGDKIHIPLPEDEAIRLFARVKPTKEMPRPGANPTKAKGKTKTAPVKPQNDQRQG